jgi:hypothetical protein
VNYLVNVIRWCGGDDDGDIQFMRPLDVYVCVTCYLLHASDQSPKRDTLRALLCDSMCKLILCRGGATMYGKGTITMLRRSRGRGGMVCGR